MALEPITRQEQIIAGKDLEPITRTEMFLKQYGGSSDGSSGGADWNASEGGPGYVKNRTHWAETATLLDNATVVGSYAEFDPIGLFNEGQTYRVVFDGVPYDCIGINPGGATYLGNGTLDAYDLGNNEPFLVLGTPSHLEIITSDGNSHAISIVGEVVHKIDPKYISGIAPRLLIAKGNRMYSDNELTNELKVIEALWRSDILAGRQVFVFDSDNEFNIYLITNVISLGNGSNEVHCGHKVFYTNGYSTNQ